MKKNTGKTGKSAWTLRYDSFEPAEERLRESLCTLSNGYFGTRGAANETRESRISYPGTYIAGLYNKLPTRIAGKEIYNEDLVNCPNWLYLTFRLGKGEWISLNESEIINYRQELDMRHGILSREICFADRKGKRINVRSERIVHMGSPHIGAVRYVISPVNYTGPISIRSGLDGTVENTGVARYRELNSLHLREKAAGFFGKSGAYLAVKTNQSRVQIAQAARLDVAANGKKISPRMEFIKKKKAMYQDFTIDARKKGVYQVDKIVAIYTSRDKGVKDPLRSAVNAARTALRYNALMREHKEAWSEVRERCGYRVESTSFVQKAVNLHTFHLLQSATQHNQHIDAGLPARGLHGEAYRGHIFWDGIFVLPMYDYQRPVVSRALLLYRYRRLARAREYARENGYKGAMFPWQSGSTGEEETQSIHLNPLSGRWGSDYSRNQRHVSFAIAYNIWQHWERARDADFMRKYGAEMLLSIAKFGASLARYSEKDGKFHTQGLMGPDEFHERMPLSRQAGYTDNAYTNIMIVWTLRKAKHLIETLPGAVVKGLMKKAGVTGKDMRHWENIIHRMNVIMNGRGIIEQFQGFFSLKELDWKHYRKKYGNIHRMDRILKAEGKSPNAYKALKQADVLMMFYLIPFEEIRVIFKDLDYRLTREIISKNYDYYASRTSHGSTLSKVTHCFLAHMLGKKEKAWKLYTDVLESDMEDAQGGTTPEGIHTGVMAGSLDILMRAFAGIDIRDETLCVNPDLPRAVKRLQFNILYGKTRFNLDVTGKLLKIKASSRGRKKEVFLKVCGNQKSVSTGEEYEFKTRKERSRKVRMGHKRILVVEGDITLAQEQVEKLRKEKFIAESLSSGEKALERIRKEWVDLVVISLKLQGEVDGLRVIKAMRENDKLSRIPVIIQTDKPGMEEALRGMGVEEIFVKPYSSGHLVEKAKELLL